MKIYTKTGDDGSTGLLGGTRVCKSEARIDCYGIIDELNAMIGWVVVVAIGSVVEQLRGVQGNLFVIGSHLVVVDGAAMFASLPLLEDSLISTLEMQIDAVVVQLLLLRNFVLPGGGELAVRLHVARTVCRWVERCAVGFAMDRFVLLVIVIYLNCLSDWLFVQVRLVNLLVGVVDVPWSGK